MNDTSYLDTTYTNGIPDSDKLKADYQYLRDARLPKAKHIVNWTADMLREANDCSNKIKYFAENYFFITSLDFGKQKIALYPAQNKVLKLLESERFVILCTSRQAGKTTLMTIYALWLACFQRDKRIVLVANKERTAKMILRRIQTAYKQLPNWIKPGIEQWGSTEIVFDNDSSIAISTTSGSAVRGESLNVLIIDEMAHIQSHLIDEFWGSVIPAISSSMKTKIFAVSTPNGAGDKFHEILTGSETGKNEWKSGKIYWWDIPGRGKKWQRDMLSALGGDMNLFKQEFENVFLESGESVINIELYEKLQANLREPELIFDDHNYRIWEEPKAGQIYTIGVDIGEGIGRASSVAQILNITDLANIKQVGIYRNNMLDPTYFAEILSRIGNHWGRPPMLIERNNCGGETITSLKTVHKYTNIVSYGLDESDIREGIYSHTNTKYHGVMNMRYWINGVQAVTLNDYTTLYEMKNFVRYPNGTWKKRPGDNLYDDCVMALIWGLFILYDKLVKSYYEVIEYDDRGKPLKILPYEVGDLKYFTLDPFFQKYDEAPVPTLIGSNTPNDGPGGFRELLSNGWQFLN